MEEKIQNEFNALMIGLADLYVKKEEIEKQIVIQRAAILQCKQLLKEV